MRILIDIPEPDVQALDEISRTRKAPRAQIIREALKAFLKTRSDTGVEDAFGLWRGREPDGLAYQRTIREEW
jgi:metal-responsive CopG/Arc/MetJ family transcriptional regulator